MNVAVIGSGYVGTTTAVVLASIGHQVVAIDVNPIRVQQLSQGVLPFVEPDLDQLLVQMLAAGKLSFTTDIDAALSSSLVIMLTVPTPATERGTADLSYLCAAADGIARTIDDYKVIVTKSTVPPGTNAQLSAYLAERVGDRGTFDVLANPEFLREGSALNDSLRPERTVIGGTSVQAIEILKELYAPLNSHYVISDWETAEMIKYASNSFLAAKISFMNEIARIADKTGADVVEVAYGMGFDARIGPNNLMAGLGYGGSCFPKDVKALIATARSVGVDIRMLEAIEYINQTQYALYIEKLKNRLQNQAQKPWQIAVLGLTFKPETDDQRESPAILVVESLLAEGAVIKLVDPTVMRLETTPWRDAPSQVEVVDTVEAALTGSDAAIICTNWRAFRDFDWSQAPSLMRQPIVVDARNMLDPDELAALRLEYVALGRRGSH